MRCAHCGSMIGPTDPSCKSCGTAVVPVAPSAPPTQSFPPQSSPPPSAGSPAPTAASADQWAVPKPGEEWGVPGYQGTPTWQQPAQPYAYTAQAPPRSAGAGFSIAGIICGVIALFFCPIVFGIAGLVLSGKAKSRGEPLAGTARIFSIVGLIGGFIIGALVYTQM